MDQRGLLLHAALQMLWEQLQDSRRLAALDESALDALIGECVRQAAGALQAEVGSGRRRARRASDSQFDLFAVLSPVLERECQRARVLDPPALCARADASRPSRWKRPSTWPSSPSAEAVCGCVSTASTVSRKVARCSTTRAAVPVSPDWYGERPTHPQLLAYLTALGSDVVALATVNLTAREVRFTGVAASGDLLPRVKAVGRRAAADWGAQQSPLAGTDRAADSRLPRR